MIVTVNALGCRALAAGILVLCAIAASAPAGAQTDPNILVSVTAVPGTVTLSRPGAPSHASYRFTITNNTSRNLNLVRFRGATTVAGDVAPFINPNVSETGVVLDPNPVVVSSSTAACTIAGSTIDCIVGDAGNLPRGGVASFYAVVRAPTTGSSVSFDWNVRHGSGAAEGSITGSTVTPLEAGTGDSASAYVPRAGATLLTGFEAIPTTGDRATTRVSVLPQDATAIIASVAEDDNGGSSCSPNVQCFGATLSVLKHQTQTKASVGDGLMSPLVIVLRRDASTVKGSIKNATIYYQTVPNIGGGGNPVRACVVNGTYTPPAANQPCIRERREYTRRNAPTPDLISDWEFILEADDNGRFIM